MKISTKGRYGIRALIDLAVNSTNGHVSLVNIANRNQISVHYLEHVFSSLKRGGIVKSVKGAQGGYVLADKPENITVAQMILALEGSYSIEPESVNEDALCETVSKVMDTLLWDRVNEETKRILESITVMFYCNIRMADLCHPLFGAGKCCTKVLQIVFRDADHRRCKNIRLVRNPFWNFHLISDLVNEFVREYETEQNMYYI